MEKIPRLFLFPGALSLNFNDVNIYSTFGRNPEDMRDSHVLSAVAPSGDRERNESQRKQLRNETQEIQQIRQSSDDNESVFVETIENKISGSIEATWFNRFRGKSFQETLTEFQKQVGNSNFCLNCKVVSQQTHIPDTCNDILHNATELQVGTIPKLNETFPLIAQSVYVEIIPQDRKDYYAHLLEFLFVHVSLGQILITNQLESSFNKLDELGANFEIPVEIRTLSSQQMDQVIDFKKWGLGAQRSLFTQIKKVLESASARDLTKTKYEILSKIPEFQETASRQFDSYAGNSHRLAIIVISVGLHLSNELKTDGIEINQFEFCTNLYKFGYFLYHRSAAMRSLPTIIQQSLPPIVINYLNQDVDTTIKFIFDMNQPNRDEVGKLSSDSRQRKLDQDLEEGQKIFAGNINHDLLLKKLSSETSSLEEKSTQVELTQVEKDYIAFLITMNKRQQEINDSESNE